MGTWTRWLLLALPLLGGCEGFWQKPSSSSSDIGSTTLSSGVFFVLNQTKAQIASYYISSGALKSPSGSPYALTLTESPVAIALSPNGNYLYVCTATYLYGFSIGTNGALTALSSGGVLVSGDSDYASLAVDKSGSWLLIGGSGKIYAVPISSSSGLYDSSSGRSTKYTTAPGSVRQLAVSPDNSFVFSAGGSSGSAATAFTASGSNPFGSQYKIDTLTSSGSAVSVAVDPSSRLFYVGEVAATTGSSNTGGVRVFNLSYLETYSTVVETSGSPFSSGGLAPYFILPKHSGDQVFVANRTVSSSTVGNIVALSLSYSGSASTLSSLATISTGYYTTSLAEDGNNNFVLATNFGQGGSAGGNPDLAGYVFNTTTSGKLDYVLASSTGSDPVGAVQVVAIR